MSEREMGGGVDILVSNAGIIKLSSIADADDVLFDQQIAVNLKGVFKTLKAERSTSLLSRSHFI